MRHPLAATLLVTALPVACTVACNTAPVPHTSPQEEPEAPALPPLGASVQNEVLSFRVPSRNATRVEVWIYDGDTLTERLNLTRADDDTWFGSTPYTGQLHYGLRAWGPNFDYDPTWEPGSLAGFGSDVDAQGNRFNPNKLLLDPYAREHSRDPGTDWRPYASGEWREVDSAPDAPRSVVVLPVEPPRPGPARPPQDEVIYEVHVRGLTMLDPDIPEALRGTYAGAALKAPELASLGVTAIELLPIHETSNDQNDLSAEGDGDNYWGYSTTGFFAPDRRYASDRSPGGPTREFRDMVDAFHAAGLSVLLDVVYNHTSEGSPWDAGDTAAILSLRGLDNRAFYQLYGPQGYRNDNGVGPNLNAGDPIVRNLVIDSLRYFREELGVDGFRFDLAPILGNVCADTCWNYQPHDPEGIFVRAVNEVGGLLIAEPWGASGDAYQAGNFPTGWAEWNDNFRDVIRADQNRLGVQAISLRSLVDVFVGSPFRFGDDGRQPWSSVAFIVAHDGFTLADLYRCNDRVNDHPWPYGPSDGGSSNNISWDQGGNEADQRRAARTGMALTLLASGIPMFNGGDELLRSQRCNNNAYNLDSPGTWIDWPTLESEASAFRTFTQRLLAFRAAHAALRPAVYRTYDELVLYEPSGSVASDAYLDNTAMHALAFWLDAETLGDDARALMILYNGWQDGVTFNLPPTPSGGPWKLVADTHGWLEDAQNVLEVPSDLPNATYLLGARSVSVLIDP